MQVFLGMAVQMRALVDGYATIVAPLTELTSKNVSFPMSEQKLAAFEKINVAITTTTVMAILDPAKPFVERTDASDLAMGGVLQQDGLNMAFINRKL